MCHYVLQEYLYLAKQSKQQRPSPRSNFYRSECNTSNICIIHVRRCSAATKSLADNNNLFYTRSISFSHFASCIDAIASHSNDSHHDDTAYLKCLDSVRDKNVPKGNLFSFTSDTHTHTHGQCWSVFVCGCVCGKRRRLLRFRCHVLWVTANKWLYIWNGFHWCVFRCTFSLSITRM